MGGSELISKERAPSNQAAARQKIGALMPELLQEFQRENFLVNRKALLCNRLGEATLKTEESYLRTEA